MRTTSRHILSFAILSGLMLASAPAWAWVKTYTLTSCPEGWTSKLGGTSGFTTDGLKFNNSDYYIQSCEFSTPITNLSFKGKINNADSSRSVTITAGSDETINKDNGLTANLNNVFYTKALLAEDNVRWFKCKSNSGTSYIVVKSVTIYRVNPPPVLETIDNDTVKSDLALTNLLTVSSEVDSDDDETVNDNIRFTHAATFGGNALESGLSVYEDDGEWYYRFSPAEAGVEEGNVEITITPHGIGGAGASKSFTVTVVPAGAPPSIDQIAPQSVLALRRLEVPFTVTELDGDAVETNAICDTVGVLGTYGINTATGRFTYTPDVEDAALAQPIRFGIVASDGDGAVTNYFNVTVGLGSKPDLGNIADQTVAFGGTNVVTLALTATDGDPITATNVQHVADAPAGDYSISNLVFRFVPAAADIGQTFTFNASATDIDGTTNITFKVTVANLPAPVLAHCTIDNWGRNYFTASLETESPGADGYDLRYFYKDDGNVEIAVTNYNVSFPCVVDGLLPINYTYVVRAFKDGAYSEWSNTKAIDLASYRDFVAAIPMTEANDRTYPQDFNGLLSSGSAYWYDGRTIPGWYATAWWNPMTDVLKYYATDNPRTADGVFSVEGAEASDRSLVFRAGDQYVEFTVGVILTNCCRYAITNLYVEYSGVQCRKMVSYASQLEVNYGRSDGAITGILDRSITNKVADLAFTAEKGSGYLTPASETKLSANLPLVGEDAVPPGGSVAISWYVFQKNNYPAIGIDDVKIRWDCAWPAHTVIYLR